MTKTDQEFGEREILKKSDLFIDRYEIDGSNTLVFPQDDLEVLYRLRAWSHPERFPNTDIDEKEIILDSKGNAKVRKKWFLL